MTMKNECVVKTNGLSKIYKGKTAVDHMDMEVRAGEIYGFIGRNGSGKSTTLKMICGLSHPTEGEIRLFNSTVADEMVRRRIGMLIEETGTYPHMTARDNILLKSMCLGITDFGCVNDILKLVGLSATGKKKVKQFSMGMKQRLGIGMALIGNPDLLILDEPINGLDPEGIREIREILGRLNKEQGKTIIISSHILGELSKIATVYGIIKDGKLIQQISKEALEERCKTYLLLEVSDTERAAALIEEQYPNVSYKVYDRSTIHLYEFTDAAPLIQLLVAHDILVLSCNLHSIDLEDYFLNLMEGGTQYA